MPLWSAVHEALSGYTTESNNSSFNIADVAMVIPEVVFSNVTLLSKFTIPPGVVVSIRPTHIRFRSIRI